jgi:BASS family bile acid:Na+ symporter
MLVGCVPGAMASNVLTLIARGNVSYSVSLTTSATLLSPIVVPAVLFLALREKTSFDAVAMLVNLLWMVVGPVLAGHWLSRHSKRFGSQMRVIGPILANLCILWIIAVVVASNRDRLGYASMFLVAPLLVINLLGYAAGYFGGTLLRLGVAMRRALTLEIGMQNAGLGATLATKFFNDSAAIAPALYTFGCMLTGTVLARWWAIRSDPADNAPADSR